MNLEYTSAEEIRRSMSEIDHEVSNLLELAKDPKNHGKLIEILDSTVDKIDKHVLALQDKLTEELARRTKEFYMLIKHLDSLMSEAPAFLSEADAIRWHKIVESDSPESQLAAFKKSLVVGFKRKMHNQLHIEKLTEQNITVRLILDKIRQKLMI